MSDNGQGSTLIRFWLHTAQIVSMLLGVFRWHLRWGWPQVWTSCGNATWISRGGERRVFLEAISASKQLVITPNTLETVNYINVPPNQNYMSPQLNFPLIMSPKHSKPLQYNIKLVCLERGKSFNLFMLCKFYKCTSVGIDSYGASTVWEETSWGRGPQTSADQIL